VSATRDRTDAVRGRASYLCWHVEPDQLRHRWQHGSVTAVATTRDDGAGGLHLTAVGDPDDVALVLHRVDAEIGPPAGLSVERGSAAAVPEHWATGEWASWEAHACSSAPPVHAAVEVVDLPFPEWTARIEAFQACESPDSFARPADGGRWVGVLADRASAEAPTLLAAGSWSPGPQGSTHLGGIATARRHRGRGLARAVVEHLTRVGLAAGAPVVTLDVFSANDAALSVYQRAGYRLEVQFVSTLIVC